MEVKFLNGKIGQSGKFVRRHVNIVPSLGDTVMWHNRDLKVTEVVFDLNITPDAQPAGDTKCTVVIG